MKNAFRKIILLLVVFSASFFFAAPSAKADYWGASNMAALQKQAMEELQRGIKDAIQSGLKQVAAKAVQKMIYQMMGSGGSDGGAMFITNWEDELRKKPEEATKTYMNDFFSTMTRGTSSMAGYISSSSQQGSGSFTSDLVEAAKKATTEFKYPTPDLEEYVPDTSRLISTGNWDGIDAFVFNPANNAVGFTMIAQQEFGKKLEEKKEEAKTQATAYLGFKPQVRNGKVVTPGSIVEEVQAGLEDLNNKILASAQSIPEVIMATVSRVIQESIEQGIADIEADVETEIDNAFDDQTY
jgi:hypothetical protein